MRLLFELSGEHPSLPKAEVMASIEAEGMDFKVIEDNRLLVVEGDGMKKLERISTRISLTFFINELLASAKDLKEIIDKAREIEIPEGSFRIRCRKIGGRGKISEIERKVGKVIAEKRAEKRKVNLENPDFELRVLVDGKIYFCRKIAKINRGKFEDRKVQYRPFFSPISLHPRIARALVNLSQIRKGEILLDPFCGTGGILLEAGLIGGRIVGSDIDKKMVDGCKRMLEHYGIKGYKLFQCNIADLDVHGIDAVASDFPYGRSSFVKGKMFDLYKKAFEKIKMALKNDGMAVIGLPNQEAARIGERYLKLKQIHPWRAHKSLTRYFCVYKN